MPDPSGSDPATSPLFLPIVETPTDAELIASARAGDGFAATRLWIRHEAAATAAASATPGTADVEDVVAAAESILLGAIRSDDAPRGAMRPHVLAAVREAAATVDGRGGVRTAPSLLAPDGWVGDELPDGLRDGGAVAAAFTALPTAAQEALWLAEVDGVPPTEIAAGLGLTLDRAEALVVASREGVRAAWIRQTAAALPGSSECSTVLDGLAAAPHPRRRPARTRAHVDTCAGCRAAALPTAELAHRLVALLPLLILGSASGVGFLEATRAGASAGLLDAVPALGAGHAGPAEPASTSPVAVLRPFGIAAGAAAAARLLGRIPRGALVAATGAVAASAAAVVIVAAVSTGGTDGGPFGAILPGDGGSSDVAAAAPDPAPPEIRATEIPGETAPDPEAGAGPDDSRAPSQAPDPSTSDPSPSSEPSPSEGPASDPPAGDAPAAPPTPADPNPGTPVSDPEGDTAPLGFQVGEPGDAGWRVLTVTGPPGAAFTIFDRTQVLVEGVLGDDGVATYRIRGSIAHLSIGSATSTAAFAEAGGTATGSDPPADSSAGGRNRSVPLG